MIEHLRLHTDDGGVVTLSAVQPYSEAQAELCMEFDRGSATAATATVTLNPDDMLAFAHALTSLANALRGHKVQLDDEVARYAALSDDDKAIAKAAAARGMDRANAIAFAEWWAAHPRENEPIIAALQRWRVQGWGLKP